MGSLDARARCSRPARRAGLESELSTISCEVDYARGGGSSGATVRDGGVRISITRTADGATCSSSWMRVSTATKPAAHDAKSWQVVEAGARSQGMLPEPPFIGTEAFLLPFDLSGESGVSMPLIPAISSPTRALVAAPDGARQVTPAPASTS